jgi:KipI family sensor histidine kinase inhibitor
MMKQLEGVYVQFADRIEPEANVRLHALCKVLLENLILGITDIYPGYINLYTEFDAAVVNRAKVRAWVRKYLESLEVTQNTREVIVATHYDGQDLEWVAEQTGLSVAEVIQKHSQQTYRVYTVGFAPGQPLMGTLDPALYLPRRATPRKRVPANSVAIAVAQTCIYPLPTPGGWHLLGTALEAAYDPHRAEPFLFQAGDTVRFVVSDSVVSDSVVSNSVSSDGNSPKETEALELLPNEPGLPVFHVEEAGLLDLVVDEGRFFGARFGLARSGPIDARSAHIANAVVGNKSSESLLELTLTGPVLSVLRDSVIGFAGFGMTCLLDGEEIPLATSVAVRSGQRLSFKPNVKGSRAYLAVAGGFETQAFMGSASADVQGRIGRALRVGDVLGLSENKKTRAGFHAYAAALPERISVRLLAGPQATPEAMGVLGHASFTVASLDRMGVRLTGPKVPSGEIISEPTPLGAVQITNNGDPIILLNDRGGIGGYTKPAVVHPADLPLVAQLRPGQELRFTLPKEIAIEHWFMSG